MTEDDIHSSSKGTNHGYIVEWRVVGGVKIIGHIDQVYPIKAWRQAPYDLKKMRFGDPVGDLIRPVLPHWEDNESPNSLAGYGLVSQLVAEAIIACLKTFIEAHPNLCTLADFTEFRTRACKLVFDWKITKDPVEE